MSNYSSSPRIRVDIRGEFGDNIYMNRDFDFQKLKQAADCGEKDAAYRLAEAYENGEVCKKSLVRAAFYYQLASDLGEKRADFKLAKFYLTGLGAEQNTEIVKRYFLKAGSFGIAEAYTELGKLAEFEDMRNSVTIATNIKEDEIEQFPEYVRLYRLAAEGGDAEGAYRYAEFLKMFPNRLEERIYWLRSSESNGFSFAAYELGKISEEKGNYNDALQFYVKAAQNNIPRACFDCARFYEEGLGCSSDAKFALRYYEEAYRLGVKEASFPLAKFYFEGKTVTQDLETAKKLLSVAIATEFPKALTYAGRISEHGRYGCRLDETLAAQYYRRAAELGDADGKAFYGKTMILGIGEAADYEKAFQIISEAAEQGSYYGIFYRGYCKEKGFGTKINIQNALEDYRSASQNGVFEAGERIKLLEENHR